ncbi:MAG: keto-hydroxyglutarate-aldolase/keto-deoxy-phosphogluconate aldolase, partial [Clostridia bacterium]|nr:keto-hydroxyglutarate-aldolase/keto-deoxy-phosphogluconate aldolase [Clostridia bacterium]
MMNTKLDKLFAACPVIPVAVIRSLDEVRPMLTALQNGGVTAVEITFRTACASDAIRLASEAFPNMTVGAGTVLNRAQAEEAIHAGAEFLVSPGLSPEVAVLCAEKNIPYL